MKQSFEISRTRARWMLFFFLRLQLRKQRRVGQSKQRPPAFLSSPPWQTAADPICRKCQPENKTWGWKERKGKSKNAPYTHTVSHTIHTHSAHIPSVSVALSPLLCVTHIHIYRMYTKEALILGVIFRRTHAHTHKVKCHSMNSCLLGGRRGRSEEY